MKRLSWGVAFSGGLAGAVALIFLGGSGANQPDSSSLTAPAAAQPGVAGEVLTDGLGEDLMDMGSAPGGSWYCEPDGIAWSEVFDPLVTGEPNNKTPRDAVTWVLRNSVLASQLEAVIGPLDLRYQDGEQRIEANVVLDISRAEVLAQVVGADSRPLLLSVALSDPRRSQNTTAGNVEIEFWPGQGWVLTGYSVCGSAMSGTYEPYVPLTEAERRLIDPISEDGS